MDTGKFPGKARFLYFLSQVQIILDKAATSENPALLVYTENMRTPLFMLEALTRLYKNIHNHHKFSKLNDVFKEIEDRLGSIDYYDGFHKGLISQKRMPEALTGYMQKQMNKKVKELDQELKKEKWIGKHKKGISKIIEKIDKADWLEMKEDTNAILETYRGYINGIIEKYKVAHLKFEDIESDVHELRRELRWLSIYPQALVGIMQLKTDNDPQDFLKKYLTPEIINSPYNIMPDENKLQDYMHNRPDGDRKTNHILLNNHYFYALSWMIAELGKLKDSGLKIKALEESLASVYKISKDAESLAYCISDENQLRIPEILTQSQKIAQTFFDENILENIISQ
ncbi:MAG: hypothetical protein ABI280_15765 [Ginsengibacter sp.]